MSAAVGKPNISDHVVIWVAGSLRRYSGMAKARGKEMTELADREGNWSSLAESRTRYPRSPRTET